MCNCALIININIGKFEAVMRKRFPPSKCDTKKRVNF